MRSNIIQIQSKRRHCVHTLTGRASEAKTCLYNHECHHCDFDQWLDDIDLELNRELSNCELSRVRCR
jgi:hypothetical protein